MAPLLPILGGIVMGGISAIGGASSQNAARAADQARIDAQYKYDKRRYRFDWNQTQRDYRYRLGDVQNQRENQDANLRYLEETARRNYAYDLAIRDFDYNNQVRQYNESERIYGLQRGFNALAEIEAYASEDRRYQEILTGMAFDQQSMLVDLLESEGQVIARGTAGRSAAKSVATAMANYGRNQAILAESLLSAQRDTEAGRRQIKLDRYQADLNAESRRMLKPLQAPAPMAPLSMPRPVLLDPLKPKKPPKPIKGVNSVPGASAISVAGNFINSGLSAYSMFGGKFT